MQSPTLGDEIDKPVQFGGHTVARHHAASDPSAPVVQRQRNVELVKRCSPEAQISLDVDRPAAAAAQGLLQVDAENGAIRRFERRRSGQVRDRSGGRGAGGLSGKLCSAAAGRDGPGEIDDRGAEVGVDEFAMRAHRKVPPNVGGAHFALEAPAISRSFEQKSC